MKITKLTVKNFLSIGNNTQSIDLDREGLTLVLGKNSDAKAGMDRNGAGKTSILQAIAFGLYGKPLTKIKIPNLVNSINTKGLVVTLEFERDGATYRVERGQKPNFLRFFVNDTERKEERDEAQGENRHTQEEIDRLVGMSQTMFRHIVAMSTFTDPFLKLSAADQRSIIEELLGVTQISQRADALKKQIAMTKESIRDEEATIRATTEANNRISHTIAQTRANSQSWERQSENRKRELAESISALDNINFDDEIAIFDQLDAFMLREQEFSLGIANEQREVARLRQDIRSLEKEAAGYEQDAQRINPTTQISRLRDEIRRKERDAERHTSQATKLRLECSQVRESLRNADAQICACCGQELAGTDHLATVVRNLETQCEELEARITHEEAEATHRLSEIAPIEAEVAGVEANAENEITALKNKAAERLERAAELRLVMTNHETKVREAEIAIASLGERPKGLFESRDEVYKAKQMFETLIRDLELEGHKQNPYTSQIESLETTLQEIDEEPIQKLNTLFKHQEFVLKLLTSKDSFIRKRIVDQNLAYLNNRVNFYLDKLGLPHEVQFMSDLSVEITKLGKDYDFEQLSRGEMNRVIMATSWSFRDVWESLNHSINLVFVDEMIDSGMDDSGAEAALEILKKMARDRSKNVFLISHKENLIGRVSQILMVNKANEFTTYEMASE